MVHELPAKELLQPAVRTSDTSDGAAGATRTPPWWPMGRTSAIWSELEGNGNAGCLGRRSCTPPVVHGRLLAARPGRLLVVLVGTWGDE